MNDTITRPLSTATPDRAMNPTAAEIEKGIPRSQSATMPPVSPRGTALKTSNAYFTLLNVEKSSRKINRKQIGTTTVALPGGVQEIALGVVMIGILMFRPAGIMGNAELTGRFARREKPGEPGTKT